MTSSTLQRLTRAAAALTVTDERRARQVAARDALIAKALGEGVSWQAVQDATGLNPSAVAKAIRRHDPTRWPTREEAAVSATRP